MALSGDEDCPQCPRVGQRDRGRTLCASSLPWLCPHGARMWHQPPNTHTPALPPTVPRSAVLGTPLLGTLFLGLPSLPEGLQQLLVSDCNP